MLILIADRAGNRGRTEAETPQGLDLSASHCLDRRHRPAQQERGGQPALTNLVTLAYAETIRDLHMPRLDGSGFYGALSETKPRLLDRFVLITGDLLNERTDRFLKKTGRPCGENPFMPNQIHSLVEEVAEQARDAMG